MLAYYSISYMSHDMNDIALALGAAGFVSGGVLGHFMKHDRDGVYLEVGVGETRSLVINRSTGEEFMVTNDELVGNFS